MKRTILYILIPLVLITIFYLIGAIKLQTYDIHKWGYGTITFCILTPIFIYLTILMIEMAKRHEVLGLILGIFLSTFICTGFWGFIYHFILPRL